MLFEFPYVLAA